ncbi:DUF2441 domain-containing protein [Nocardia noduli]|uniref:DUF2441 domain-containing protein n=1 Tax=Nocardia noduli TaxID=2815722 RepID=UPI001C22E522|nr:DUF2441 domain-containing protein [Nocardia noduli]
MPTYFHLNRGRPLTRGAVLGLGDHPATRSAFPTGVSPHGRRYLTGHFRVDVVDRTGITHVVADRDTGLELLWDWVRLNRYPNAPSRFQSIFAFETREDVTEFVTRYGGYDAGLWLVETDVEGFRADMSLMRAGPMQNCLRWADLYWSQQPHPRSGREAEFFGRTLWEVLLTPPVTVLTRVEL